MWGSGEAEESPQKLGELCCVLYSFIISHWSPPEEPPFLIPLIYDTLLLPPLKGELEQMLFWIWPKGFSSLKRSLQVLASTSWQDCSSVIPNNTDRALISGESLSRCPVLKSPEGPAPWVTMLIGSLRRYVSLVYWILTLEWFSWLKCPIHHWRVYFSCALHLNYISLWYLNQWI